MLFMPPSCHNNVLIALTVVSLSLATAPLAVAQMGLGGGAPTVPGSVPGVTGTLRMMPVFTDFDSDGNGQVSQSEFAHTRAQRIAERSQQGYAMRGLANAPSFADLDANDDGVLDADEFAAGVPDHHQPPTKP